MKRFLLLAILLSVTKVYSQAVYGCLDPTAANYAPLATIDDGSCTYTGCMDSTAYNYNPLATSKLKFTTKNVSLL